MNARPEHATLSISTDLGRAADLCLQAANVLSASHAVAMTRNYQKLITIRNLFDQGKVPHQIARDIVTSAERLAEAAIDLNGYCTDVLPRPLWSRR